MSQDIEKFYEKYTLEKCPNSDDGYWETYGEEYIHVLEVLSKTPKRVWTTIDCDGWYGVTAGYHYINRQQYIITNEEWETGTEEYTIYDTGPLREIWESLPKEAVEEILGYKIDHEYGSDEWQEKLDDEFYIFEEYPDTQRDEIVKKYSNGKEV